MRARLFQRTLLAIVQYTVLLVLFGVAAFKGVAVPFLAASLVSEVFGVAFLLGKMQDLAGEGAGGEGVGRAMAVGGARRSKPRGWCVRADPVCVPACQRRGGGGRWGQCGIVHMPAVQRCCCSSEQQRKNRMCTAPAQRQVHKCQAVYLHHTCGGGGCKGHAGAAGRTAACIAFNTGAERALVHCYVA